MKNDSVRMLLCSVIIFLVSVTYASASPKDNKNKLDIENAGALSGRAVLENGDPLPYGFVSFFSTDPSMGEHQDYGASKRSPKMVAFVKKDGLFETMLFPAGTYFVGAVITKRWVGGPPKEGQKRYSATDSDGKYQIVEVKAGDKVDVGTLVFRDPEAYPEREKKFTVSGRVLDENGDGVPGSVVVAKKDINDPKGDYISKKTVLLGAYELKIPPGKYFFVARKELSGAGRPKPGGLLGTLGMKKSMGLGGKSDEIPEYIIGKDGQVFKDVNITMFEVPIPEVRRKEIEAKVKAKKINKSTLPEDLPLMKKRVEQVSPSEHKPE